MSLTVAKTAVKTHHFLFKRCFTDDEKWDEKFFQKKVLFRFVPLLVRKNYNYTIDGRSAIYRILLFAVLKVSLQSRAVSQPLTSLCSECKNVLSKGVYAIWSETGLV